jgi:hypothetical protein
MADVLANMIGGVRAQFAAQAHETLRASHGHHFAPHAKPQPQPRPRPPPPRRELAEMMDLTPAASVEQQLEQKQKKIAEHNARINAINNSKSKAPEEPAPKKAPGKEAAEKHDDK